MQVVDHHGVAVAALSMFPQMRMSFGQIGVFMRQNLRLCRRPELQRARNPEGGEASHDEKGRIQTALLHNSDL